MSLNRALLVQAISAVLGARATPAPAPGACLGHAVGRNVRFWVGNRNDLVESEDSPSKLIGDFDASGTFQALSSTYNDGSTGAATGGTVKLSSATEVAESGRGNGRAELLANRAALVMWSGVGCNLSAVTAGF